MQLSSSGLEINVVLQLCAGDLLFPGDFWSLKLLEYRKNVFILIAFDSFLSV